MSQRVEKYKVVSITYSISDEAGEVVERSDLPVSYVHGANRQMFPKVEAALEGRRVGERVQVTLSPEEGFGHRDPALVVTDDLDKVPPQFRHVGARATFQNARGETLEMVVTRIADGKVTVDGNHPFAGRTMTFTVEVVGIRDASPEEVGRGLPAGGFH